MKLSRQNILLIILGSGIAGCASSNRMPAGMVKPEIIPAADSQEIGAMVRQYQGILSTGEVKPEERISEKTYLDFVVLYLPSNRDFDAGEGLEGYVLQITPLGTNQKPRPFPGELTIYLQAIPCTNASGQCPYLLAWRISPEQIRQAWRKTRLLDGYILPLHWGERAQPEGNYRFQIVMESGTEPQRQYAYRELTISDNR